MPGHGQSSSNSPQLFSFDLFADQIIALMDNLGIESTHLGGLSMGSGISLNLALRYPDRVKSLIILRPSWLNQTEPEHLKLVADVGKLILEDPLSARNNLERSSDFQVLANSNPPVAASIVALFDRPVDLATTEVLFRMWQSSPFDDLKQLRNLSHPTLVLDTTQDELHPQKVAQTLSENIPNSTHLTLPPRYHDNDSYQQALNTQINHFLSCDN